jgi:hypothetical protein
MTDTRTDREELARLICETLEPYKGEMPYDLGLADVILAAGFARRIPAPSSIAVPHTPEEIWAFADRECDLDFWDKDHLEYTPDGVLHLASNVNITADRDHLPVELRPDIGVDW